MQDEVAFADKGDLLLWGARTLEGRNWMVAAKQKKLVASGLRQKRRRDSTARIMQVSF